MIKLKSILAVLANRLLSSLVQIFPVSKKIWAFNSFPDYTDNPYGFFCKVVAKKPDVHFIWLISDKSLVKKIQAEILEKNVSVFYKKSILGFWYFLRAGYLFISHGIFEQYQADKSSKIVVNLWHGMPLKRIEFMDPTTTWVTYSDYIIATSEMFKNIMGQSFKKDAEHTLLIGQPRNDLLFDETDFFEKQKINRQEYDKVGIWLPTYRYSLLQQRTDGAFHEGQLLFLTICDLEELNSFLKIHRQLLIVKLHPMDFLQTTELPSFSNLRILKHKDLTSQLYPLLGNCDYLLTDFSSVWLDYEILGKPIGFVCDDFSSYKNGRGFTIPNLKDLLPGPVLVNLAELEHFLSHLPENRNEGPSEFNYYKDSSASDRLLALLESLSK